MQDAATLPAVCCFNTFTNAVYELTVKALKNMTYLSVFCCHFQYFWHEMALVPSDLCSHSGRPNRKKSIKRKKLQQESWILA